MQEIRKKIVETFSGLVFEEKPHKYFVEGKPIEKSVSDKIKAFYTPFNEVSIAKNKAEREGLDYDELVAEWHRKRDAAILRGKQAHLFGELYAFNPNLRPQSNLDIAVMRFWEDLPPYIKPVIAEQPMYHKKELYAGTPDNILLNTKTGNLIIIDYKTNEDLFKNFMNRKLLGKFSYMLDNSFNKYQIQLSYYKILLEQTGYKVSTTKIIWLKDNAEYAIYDTNDLTKYLI